MSFVVFCLFHRNIFLLFWYLVFSEKEMPISHITNTLTATCVGSLKRFWSRSPFFFFCSFPFTPPLSSLLFLPPTISVVFSIFSFFIFLSLNSNHLNNESGKTSRGKRCPWARRRETTTTQYFFGREKKRPFVTLRRLRPFHAHDYLVAPAQDCATRPAYKYKGLTTIRSMIPVMMISFVISFFSILSQLVTCFVSYRSFSFLLFFLFNFVSASFLYFYSITFVYLLVASNYNYIVHWHEISLDGSDLSCAGIRKKRDALLKKLHHLWNRIN